MSLPDPVGLPTLTERSAHLPCDYTPAAKEYYAGGWCKRCGTEVIPQATVEELSVEERRWRHIQHVLVSCERRRVVTSDQSFRCPRLTHLRYDLIKLLPVSHHTAVSRALPDDVRGPQHVRSRVMPLFLSPIETLGGDVRTAADAVRCIAAFITYSACLLTNELPDRTRLYDLQLPERSYMALCAPCSLTCSPDCDDSDDEVFLLPQAPPPHTCFAPPSASRGAEAEARAGYRVS